MATIAFTVSDANFIRIVNALSARYAYNQTLLDGSPNPDNRGEFVRKQIAKWIMNETREHELNTARVAVTVPRLEIT